MVGQRLGWMAASVVALLVLFLVLSCGTLTDPIVSLWASPTPSLTPTPPATPTLTPTATATATATPTATPTPLPVALSVEVLPEAPAQGQTVLVRVRLDRAATLSGDFDGQPLTFLYNSPTDGWSLLAVPVWSATGERPLVLEAIAPEGQRTVASRMIAVQESPFELQAIEVPPDQDTLLAPGLRSAEDQYLASFLRLLSPRPLWEGPFGIPAEGFRTSPFGARRSYQGGPPTGYHGGIDMAAPEGTPIYAPAAGIVAMAEPLVVRGNVIMLDHGAGVHTLYFHLSEIAVAPGQSVARGELLGLMGTTGLSTGSHLHWEVRVGEFFVDPDEWLAEDFRFLP